MAFSLFAVSLQGAQAQESPNIDALYSSSDLILLGLAMDVKETSDRLDVHFDAITPIKGKPGKTISVYFPKAETCGEIHGDATEYLVYARKTATGIWSSMCEGTKHISKSEPDLEIIHARNPKVSPQCTPDRLKKLTADSQTVVLAEVIKTDVRALFWNCWSGIARCTDYASYKTIEVFKGKAPDSQFAVDHVLVHNSLTAAESYPGLSPSLFRPGNRVILFLEPSATTRYGDRENLLKNGVSYVDIDENCGVVEATDNKLAAVRLALQQQ